MLDLAKNHTSKILNSDIKSKIDFDEVARKSFDDERIILKDDKRDFDTFLEYYFESIKLNKD